jgi:uncharacterized protein (UPF0332 family)
MLVNTDPESAVSRAYYAAFHAVTAVFALSGQSFVKHSVVARCDSKDLVKEHADVTDEITAKGEVR